MGRAQRLPAKAEGQYLLSHVSMSVESDTHGGSNAKHAPGEHAEYRLRHNRDEEVSLDARIYIYIYLGFGVGFISGCLRVYLGLLLV